LLHDGVTALGLMDIVAVEPGDRVLVTAAAGGLGALLVQLTHATGAEVVAAARGSRKLGRLRPLIGQTFPLERAADAHAGIEQRTAIGKTLLTRR
jgi:NADPH:quinone reductase-like Zn-dependent oxidoreductase